MKKITLIFVALVFGAFMANAQYTFTTVAGPVNVPNGAPVTQNMNDAGNTAGVTSGTYTIWTLTVDWSNVDDAWSSEADATITTAAGSVTIDPPSSGAANSNANTTLTFTGSLAGDYDPDVDGTLDLVFNQSWQNSSADWSNINLTIDGTPELPNCVTNESPADDATDVDASSGTVELAWENAATGGTPTSYEIFFGTVSGDLNSLGTTGATSVTITNIDFTTEYFWQIIPSNSAGAASGCNELSFTTAGPPPPPENDLCSGAIALNCDETVTGDTSIVSVTVDAQGDCGSVDNDAPNLWYSYTGSGSPENVTLSTCSQASFDTSLAVFTGACGALECYANNDDGPGCTGFTSELTFLSDGTTTYYIMVEGFNATSVGEFDLSVTCEAAATPPANDLCVDAVELIVDAAATNGDNTDATTSIVNPSCDEFGTIADVWYRFTASASGDASIITTVGSSDQANVAVWDGCDLTTATELGCSDGNGGEILDISGLTPGQEYYIQLWNDGAVTRTEGTFTVSVSSTLSVSDNQTQNKLEYYPNPTNGSFYINALQTIEAITVFNIAGQRVLETTPSATSVDLDMSELQTGAYFVRVQMANGSKTIKVMKQ